MADDFDAEKYLAEKSAAQAAFDPAKYLAEKTGRTGTALAPAPERAVTTGLEAFAGHAADNVPFMRQLAAAFEAAKLKASGNPMDFGENYRQLLTAQQHELNQSKAEHGGLSNLGSLTGLVGTAAALPGAGWKPLASLGFMSGLSNSSANPDATAGDIAKQTAMSTILAPVLGRAMEAVAPVAGRGLQAMGGKLADLAGWLKVNSIHPTPLLGEAMEDIPGGVPAVGRLLLKNGIGGLTKQGTAEQVGAAFDAATGKATLLAKAHDASGAAPIDIGDALANAQAKAESLMSRPATEEAGQKLKILVDKYAEIHGTGDGALASAQDALTLKRDLGEIGYGAKAEFKLNKNPVTGNYGKGVRQFERGIDAALDDALGPEFEQANLVVRQLGGAKQAAERSAARTAGNTITGLVPYLAAATGAASSHAAGGATPEAAAFGLAALLAGKYGAQAGARALYSPIAGGLGLMGRGLQSSIPRALAGRMAAEETAPLAAGLYRPPMSQPAMANRDGLERQQTLAQLLQGMVP